MTVTAAAAHLPRFASGVVRKFASAGFRPLNEAPAPTPAQDRLAVQDAAVAEAVAAARAEFNGTRAADLAEFERRLAEREFGNPRLGRRGTVGPDGGRACGHRGAGGP